MNDLDAFLDETGSPWRRRAFEVICETPSGWLISYGRIAGILFERFGINVSPRNIGWLRNRLYSILTHETDVPLHRVATQWDVDSENDSDETKELNDELRGQEGSLTNPKWL